MFENKRHFTKGVKAIIEFELQILIWSLIDNWRDKIELDYLQVFELSVVEFDGIMIQKIIHTQEIPPYKEEGLYKIEEPVNGEVWVMDSDEYCMMLLPEEN